MKVIDADKLTQWVNKERLELESEGQSVLSMILKEIVNGTFDITDRYIGIDDSNGKKMYEGSIMKITFDSNYSEEEYYVGVIKYGAERGYPAFDLEPWIDCDMNAISWLKSESDPSVIKYEVIGSIRDNPELLEAKQ
ncbi:YopX family protein [Paenibacillus sp. 1781tsa1]|uniref:YopX family protein n=1 Tax=Paenibacillus sp. 1781tsa1 TaxID=2953810 RepID=UPI0020A1B9EA|nr:YopX family protein [Paenibacillus sp. 1781tsa1]MCP1184916.1 YopX family protein [Paenibacillus sp. 1781tsa1]